MKSDWSRLIHGLIIIGAVTSQLVLAIWLDRATPQLVLAGLLALSLAGDLIDSVWWLGFGGILLDLLGGNRPGLYLLTLTAFSLTLVILNRQLFHQPDPRLAMVIFTIFSGFFELLVNGLTGGPPVVDWISILLTAAIASLSYSLIRRISRQRESVHLANPF